MYGLIAFFRQAGECLHRCDINSVFQNDGLKKEDTER